MLLRLPYEVKDLFREWLAAHYPDRAKHVMSLVNEARGGRDNDPNFGSRMRGTGPYAELLRMRFQVATRKLGLNAARARLELDTTLFRPPGPALRNYRLRLNPREPLPALTRTSRSREPDLRRAVITERAGGILHARELAITALPHRYTGNPP